MSQVKSFRNQAAPEGHVRIADGIARWFNEREDATAVADFLVARDAAQALSMDLERMVRDLPAHDRQALADLAFDALRPFLSPSLRKGTRGQWLSRLAALPSTNDQAATGRPAMPLRGAA